jgi:rubrerythrin
MGHWTLETINWDRFDPSKVDPEIVRNIKAAAMVERNGDDYGVYLRRVFADDPDFIEKVDEWVSEENQHGMALGRWAQLADPGWNFEAAFARFKAGYHLPHYTTTTKSVRGSQAGEMMARCIVETGTSSYYSALKDATAEPVLKQICTKIAADELRHYKLFYDQMHRSLKRDGLNRLQRLWIGWGRIAESEDDELAYAYFASNEPADAVYDRKRYTEAYARRAYPLYGPSHVQRAMAMILKAVGLKPQGWLNQVMTRAGLWFLRNRAAKLAAESA